MTCAVAVESPEGVWVGCDSWIGTEGGRDVMDRPKWFLRNDLLIAYAGDMRAPQVAEYAPRFRGRGSKETVLHWLISAVIEKIRQSYAVYDVKEPDVEYLIAYQGGVYVVQNDYSVIRSQWGYSAIGAGSEVALGSLASTSLVAPKKRVERALLAAERHSQQVARPFHKVLMRHA